MDEIEKAFRRSWDRADYVMEQSKKICEEYKVS